MQEETGIDLTAYQPTCLGQDVVDDWRQSSYARAPPRSGPVRLRSELSGSRSCAAAVPPTAPSPPGPALAPPTCASWQPSSPRSPTWPPTPRPAQNSVHAALTAADAADLIAPHGHDALHLGTGHGDLAARLDDLARHTDRAPP